MNLQLRAEVQASALQWANNLMVNYNVPAAMIEDAVNALLVKLKEQILVDTIAERMQQEEASLNEGEDNGDGEFESD